LDASRPQPASPPAATGSDSGAAANDPCDVLDALPHPVAILDAKGVVTRINHAWREAERACAEPVFSCDVDACLLEHLEAHPPIPRAQSGSLRQAILDVLAGKMRTALGVVGVRDHSSEIRWFEARVGAFENADSRAATVSLIDVTESQRDRERLADSELRFRLLAENSTDWITRHAPDGTYQWVSPACREMLGYEPEELVGRNPYDFFHPEDRPTIERSHESILAQPRTSSVEYRFRCANGAYVWLDTTSRAITHPATGELAELQCASRDVTHRRQTQTLLQLIQTAIEQVKDAVVITEPDLDLPGPRIVYVNHSFLDMTGYEESEVIGQTPRILQGPKTDRKVLDRLRRDLQERGAFSGETTNYRKNGEPYMVEWTITAVRDTSGKLINWVSIQRDITERLQAQADQEELQKQLAHAGRLTTLGELASGLAHELNQPLTAVSNFAHGIERRLDAGGIDPDDLGNAIEHIAAQADRAGEIIQRLRGFVKKREPKVATEPLHELIDDVRTLLTYEIQRSGTQLATDFDEELAPVLANRVQIEQVLINIIRNAIEAAQEEGGESGASPRIEIRARNESRRIHIEITDFGPGLSHEVIDRIFDPFFSSKDEGMGMGLTICHSIVQMHNGRLWAEPNPDGRGLTFHLLLNAAA
jgi:two-component system, LuxR family, sensor kinase FixL